MLPAVRRVPAPEAPSTIPTGASRATGTGTTRRCSQTRSSRDDAAGAAPGPLAAAAQPAKFVLVGAGGYVVNLAVFALPRRRAASPYIPNSIVSYFVANALMYLGNRYFTFRLGNDGFWSAYLRYMIVGARGRRAQRRDPRRARRGDRDRRADRRRDLAAAGHAGRVRAVQALDVQAQAGRSVEVAADSPGQAPRVAVGLEEHPARRLVEADEVEARVRRRPPRAVNAAGRSRATASGTSSSCGEAGVVSRSRRRWRRTAPRGRPRTRRRPREALGLGARRSRRLQLLQEADVDHRAGGAR